VDFAERHGPVFALFSCSLTLGCSFSPVWFPLSHLSYLIDDYLNRPGGVLIFGVGLEMSPSVCGSAIYICIAFYATSKILIYAFLSTCLHRLISPGLTSEFLVEKVHVVWSPATGSSRFKSRVYLFCFITLVAYALTVATVMLAGMFAFGFTTELSTSNRY
jgi:hypothetical protein